MPRVRSVVTRLKRRKRLLKRVKGFRGSLHKKKRQARAFAIRAGKYAYRDRRMKKREFRSLWITRIKAAVRDLLLEVHQRLEEGADHAGPQGPRGARDRGAGAVRRDRRQGQDRAGGVSGAAAPGHVP